MVEIINWIAFTTTVIYYLSPSIFIAQLIYKKIKITNASCFVLNCCLLNGILWFILGIKKEREDNLIWSNFIGSILSFIWLIIYFFYYTDAQKNALKYGLYVFTITDLVFEISFIELDIIENDNNDERKNIIRGITSFINVFMYITPGLNILKLFKEWNHKYIIMPMALIGSINTIIWFIIGIKNERIDMKISNGIGAVACIFQTTFYFVNFKKNISSNEGQTDNSIGDNLMPEQNHGINSEKIDDKKNERKSGKKRRKPSRIKSENEEVLDFL